MEEEEEEEEEDDDKQSLGSDQAEKDPGIIVRSLLLLCISCLYEKWVGISRYHASGVSQKD